MVKIKVQDKSLSNSAFGDLSHQCYFSSGLCNNNVAHLCVGREIIKRADKHVMKSPLTWGYEIFYGTDMKPSMFDNSF